MKHPNHAGHNYLPGMKKHFVKANNYSIHLPNILNPDSYALEFILHHSD